MQIFNSYCEVKSTKFDNLTGRRFQINSSLPKKKAKKKTEETYSPEEAAAYLEWIEEFDIESDKQEDVNKEWLKKSIIAGKQAKKDRLKREKVQAKEDKKLQAQVRLHQHNKLRSFYSYPPKFAVKWGDELQYDLFLAHRYSTLEHSLPFMDYLEDFLFVRRKHKPAQKVYSKNDYIEGVFNRIITSSFYNSKSNPIGERVNTVPVYTLVNSYGQIITIKMPVAMGTGPDVKKTKTQVVNEMAYTNAGAFDPSTENAATTQLGLFFFSYADANQYLLTLADADWFNMAAVGTSVDCIGLDSAYRITREHHPNVDFRFIPDYEEVTRLLDKQLGTSDTVVEDEQQQLRFRRRSVQVIPEDTPKIGKYCEWLTPLNSFLHQSEYFKGVPIYIVQSTQTPRNFLLELCFKVADQVDGFYGRFVQGIDFTMGFGENWIMQGSLFDAGSSDRFKTYVFFEKEQAVEFTKSLGRKAARFEGARCVSISKVVRKPRIMVYNLEDFFERWEETLQPNLIPESKKSLKGMFEPRRIMFIPPRRQPLTTELKKQIPPYGKGRQTFNMRFNYAKRLFRAPFEISVVQY